MPRYPIYVPSKGRAGKVAKTIRFLLEDEVPFYIVVEKQEYDGYKQAFPTANILIAPFQNEGAVPVRNWIWQHSIGLGHKRHWQLDDNMYRTKRLYRGKRIEVHSDIAISAVEDFTDRYENIAIAGMNYSMFVTHQTKTPLVINTHVYSCMLFLNEIPHRWRGPWNADTDICLQVLADGWCTVLFNAFVIDKQATMLVKGGNTAKYHNDGRLKMARELERKWPGVVKVVRKWGRPQHSINWKRFTAPLKRRKDIDWNALETNNYGMKLVQKKDKVKSKRLRRMMKEQ